MYIIFGIFLITAILFSVIFFFRRKAIICKICTMSRCKKYNLLNKIIEPFGFQYNLSQDVITSRVDAMQRDFGYTDLYDNAAAYFNMVFDCEPIYFDYNGYTWRFEFWKGQYGINVGAEIGLYRADHIVPSCDRPTTVFYGVDESEMMPMSLALLKDDHTLYNISCQHWWLTGFSMGRFTYPECLTAKIAITFPNQQMLDTFLTALRKTGYSHCEYYSCELTIYLTFDESYTNCPCHDHPFHRWLSQTQNRFFCKLYRWATRPFCTTLDRLLFLYFCLPFAFRHMCNLRIFKKKGRIR